MSHSCVNQRAGIFSAAIKWHAIRWKVCSIHLYSIVSQESANGINTYSPASDFFHIQGTLLWIIHLTYVVNSHIINSHIVPNKSTKLSQKITKLRKWTNPIWETKFIDNFHQFITTHLSRMPTNGVIKCNEMTLQLPCVRVPG